MALMGPEERSEFARNGANVRWDKSRQKSDGIILAIPIVDQLETMISALKPKITELRQELSQRQRELSALEVARRRLIDQKMSCPDESVNQVSGKAESSISVKSRPPSIALAARGILRERGIPMRVRDILHALHEAGHTNITSKRLNLALDRDSRKGILSHPETGIYGYIDSETRRQQLLGIGLPRPTV
jgi:hypothetical protein